MGYGNLEKLSKSQSIGSEIRNVLLVDSIQVLKRLSRPCISFDFLFVTPLRQDTVSLKTDKEYQAHWHAL